MRGAASVAPAGSLLALARDQLERLCPVVALDGRVDEILSDLAATLGEYALRRIDDGPLFPSDVCDDHTPFEFSITIEEGVRELRVLVEAAGGDFSLGSMQAAGRGATHWIREQRAAVTDRLDSIEDLFLAAEPQGLFTRWHALEYRGSRPPRIKVYLNPRLAGPEQARERVDQALHRLGRDDARRELDRRIRRGGLDEVKYFALDLDATPSARLKVYVRHHDLTASQLEAYFAETRDYPPGVAEAFCRAMLGPDPWTGKPVFSCLSWIDSETRPKPTVYAPLSGYAANEAVARNRVASYMMAQGIDHAALDGALSALAGVPLWQARGVVSYASARWDGVGPPRVTAYLSPLAYRPARTPP